MLQFMLPHRLRYDGEKTWTGDLGLTGLEDIMDVTYGLNGLRWKSEDIPLKKQQQKYASATEKV